MSTKTYHPVVLLGRIGDHRPDITPTAIAEAVAPAQLSAGTFIDLRDVAADEVAASWEGALESMTAQLKDVPSTAELAVFAFAPIPLLVAFGRLLGDKQPARVFDCLRPTGTWRWESEPPALGWKYEPPRRSNAERKDVAVLLSLSGTVDHKLIERWLPASYDIYEIALAAPAPSVIRSEAQLDEFRGHWRKLLDDVRQNHGSDARIHLFPAIPLSVAIECGRRLLPKVDPEIHVYDNQHRAFHYALTIGGPETSGPVRVEASMNVPQTADIVVIVALAEELRELKKHWPAITPVADATHGGSDFFAVLGSGKAAKSAVVRLVSRMGPSETQLAADRAITRWRPKLAVNIGISGALDNDLALGDVIVADQVDAYDDNLKAVDGDDGWKPEHRGVVFHGNHALVQSIRGFEFADPDAFVAWQQAAGGKAPALHVGHIASGGYVGASDDFKDWLRSRDGKFLAIEMEAAGLARAAEKHTTPTPWLVIRGICDAADGQKAKLEAASKGHYRELAMANATRLFISLLERGHLK